MKNVNLQEKWFRQKKKYKHRNCIFKADYKGSNVVS